MLDDEIFKIANATSSNRYILAHLDDKTIEMLIEIMERLDANDFKEINPDASFEFNDIPIPYKRLNKQRETKVEYSDELSDHLTELQQKINKNGTNIEYPFAIRSAENSDEYSKIKPFSDGNSQSCSYDWEWIEDYIKNCDGKVRLSLLHTHPNPLDKPQNTIFNKYSEQLSELGIQPNGLNISLSDIYVNQYLQMLVDKYGKEINVESTILMFDGTLISFSTQNGVVVTNELQIENINQKNQENLL